MLFTDGMGSWKKEFMMALKIWGWNIWKDDVVYLLEVRKTREKQVFKEWLRRRQGVHFWAVQAEMPIYSQLYKSGETGARNKIWD